MLTYVCCKADIFRSNELKFGEQPFLIIMMQSPENGPDTHCKKTETEVGRFKAFPGLIRPKGLWNKIVFSKRLLFVLKIRWIRQIFIFVPKVSSTHCTFLYKLHASKQCEQDIFVKNYEDNFCQKFYEKYFYVFN